MFDRSQDNPPVPSFLRLVTAVECFFVFTAGSVAFFLPDLAAKLWPWPIPPFNSRFVGAIYLAALIPLVLFWFVPRWKPGRLTVWLILVFTAMILLVMLIHWKAFAWDRPSTFLAYWPLYIFLPINSTIFLLRFRGAGATSGFDGPPLLRTILLGFAFASTVYGLGMLIAPEPLTRFWPWSVDAFHARIYAAAFFTPAVGTWMMSLRRQIPAEYLTMGLNLLAGGILPILGTVWTHFNVPVERQVDFSAPGTWLFFMIFASSILLGSLLLRIAFQISRNQQ